MATVKVVLKVEATLAHTSGKFASKDELADALVAELEGADPGEVMAYEGGEYTVEDFTVEAYDETPRTPLELMAPELYRVLTQIVNGNVLDRKAAMAVLAKCRVRPLQTVYGPQGGQR